MKKSSELFAVIRNKRISLPAVEEAERKACEFVRKLLVCGESNSVLILGPQGCGKTTVMEAARKKCLSPEEKFIYNPVVIDINGT
uniref:AAA family ATPase n=1 Tax=Trichuris muris TaxID=70415 RepID=A0A5S6QI14_TRIMR